MGSFHGARGEEDMSISRQYFVFLTNAGNGHLVCVERVIFTTGDDSLELAGHPENGGNSDSLVRPEFAKMKIPLKI